MTYSRFSGFIACIIVASTILAATGSAYGCDPTLPIELCKRLQKLDKTMEKLMKKSRDVSGQTLEALLFVKGITSMSRITSTNSTTSRNPMKTAHTAWRKVDPSMVSNSYKNEVNLHWHRDSSGGLKVVGKVTERGCADKKHAFSLVEIKGNWQQIMFTQIFRGSASCWRIFGESIPSSKLKDGLEQFNPTMGDIIFNQRRMGSKTVDEFAGSTYRCDNEKDNFWHSLNGAHERKATVMLRRKKGAKNAGIYTWTSCGLPEYEIKDIFVLM